jgi:hypothetical protein
MAIILPDLAITTKLAMALPLPDLATMAIANYPGRQANPKA